MTDDILTRARAAVEGVTEGPWEAVATGWADDFNEVMHDNCNKTICFVSGADCVFIAAARTLVPEMADTIEAQGAEITRLRAENAALRAQINATPKGETE